MKISLIPVLSVIIILTSCVKEKPVYFEYVEYNKKITITGYTGESKDVVIPAKIDRYPVTVLEDDAFAFKQIESIVIPKTVTIIGNNTFMGNQLISLNIPDSVTYIGNYAFAWNQITGLKIPKSVEFIGGFAFLGNNLASLTLPANAEIELNAFNNTVFDYYNKNEKKAGTFDITFETFDEYNIAVLNNSIAEIISYTGQDKEIIIPDMINNYPVISIGYSSFFGHELTNITIPNSVIIIGPYAFAGNKLDNVIIPDSVTIIGENAFRESAINNVVIPNSVTVIGDNAFTHNKLTNINLPDSVVSIGHYAFTYNQLTNVIIPNSVIEFGFGVFDVDVSVSIE